MLTLLLLLLLSTLNGSDARIYVSSEAIQEDYYEGEDDYVYYDILLNSVAYFRDIDLDDKDMDTIMGTARLVSMDTLVRLGSPSSTNATKLNRTLLEDDDVNFNTVESDDSNKTTTKNQTFAAPQPLYEDGADTDAPPPSTSSCRNNNNNNNGVVLLADLRTYSLENITKTAAEWEIDFIVLILEDHDSWKERVHFWWTHEIPGMNPLQEDNFRYSNHSYYEAPPLFLVVSRKTGTFLLDLLQYQELENSYTSSSCLPHIQIQLDDLSPLSGQDIALLVRGALYFIILWALARSAASEEENDNNTSGDTKPKYTGDELGQGIIQEGTTCQDCAICLEALPAGTTVRILPCRHMFHDDCIKGWFREGQYSCPMCKYDLCPYLEEQRDAAHRITPTRRRDGWRRMCGWRRIQADENQLLDGDTAEDVGDLELTTEESPQAASPADNGVIV